MGEKPSVVGVVEAAAAVGFSPLMLATCVPAKAKNKNMMVPTNSLKKATKSMIY